MIITKKNDYERESTVEKLLNDGLTAEEIGKNGIFDNGDLQKCKKIGLKTNVKKRGFKAIGDKVFEDYQKGYTINEIAERYDKEPKSIEKLIYYCKNYKAENKRKIRVKAVNVESLKIQLALYRDRLDRAKRRLKIGKCVIYKGKSYIVVEKYTKFVVLQGKEYQITAMYDDFVKAEGSVADG